MSLNAADKSTAHDRGWPVPTFEEFKTKYNVDMRPDRGNEWHSEGWGSNNGWANGGWD